MSTLPTSSLSPENLNGRWILVWAGTLIAAIALVDWYYVEENISFGFLYLFPMLMLGARLPRWQLAGIAGLCTALTEAFDPFPWEMSVGISRLVLEFVAFFGASLYGFASTRNRELNTQHLAEIEREVELRRQTEEQLDFLISTSPATIFTLDATGRILLANKAAHRLLRVEHGELQGQSISNFLPALASVPPSSEKAPFFHTEMECTGRREDGEVFLGRVWFSTYRTTSGPRLAAVVFDASEELRDRAELNWQQVLSGSKISVSAVCHEIRNLCGAIASVHSKLARDERLACNEDFSAFHTLVKGLGNMAGLELRHTTQPFAETTDIGTVLDELRIVIQQSFHELEISIVWDVPESLPRVWADRQALLQAFLNIAKNSQRAMLGQAQRELKIQASAQARDVIIRFIDSGPGVSNPERLFAPFQPGAQSSGLGLYLSRTFVRAFQGDIEYEPQPDGSCFAVKLALAKHHRPALAATGEQCA